MTITDYDYDRRTDDYEDAWRPACGGDACELIRTTIFRGRLPDPQTLMAVQDDPTDAEPEMFARYAAFCAPYVPARKRAVKR